MDASAADADCDAELAALLKEQAEFLRSNKKPAAQVQRVTRLPTLNPDAAPPPKPLKKSVAEAAAEPPPPQLPPVVTEIRERAPVVGVMLPQRPASGFPRAVHRSALSLEERRSLTRPAASSTTTR